MDHYESPSDSIRRLRGLGRRRIRMVRGGRGGEVDRCAFGGRNAMSGSPAVRGLREGSRTAVVRCFRPKGVVRR
jgi:hypothetical protein